MNCIGPHAQHKHRKIKTIVRDETDRRHPLPWISATKYCCKTANPQVRKSKNRPVKTGTRGRDSVSGAVQVFSPLQNRNTYVDC